jgi:hypothetical protein
MRNLIYVDQSTLFYELYIPLNSFFFLWVYIDFGIYVCEGNLDFSAAAHDRGDFGAAVEDGEEEEMVFSALELVLSTLLQVVYIM